MSFTKAYTPKSGSASYSITTDYYFTNGVNSKTEEVYRDPSSSWQVYSPTAENIYGSLNVEITSMSWRTS